MTDNMYSESHWIIVNPTSSLESIKEQVYMHCGKLDYHYTYYDIRETQREGRWLHVRFRVYSDCYI